MATASTMPQTPDQALTDHQLAPAETPAGSATGGNAEAAGTPATKKTRHAANRLTVGETIALARYLEANRAAINAGRIKPRAVAEAATRDTAFLVTPSNVLSAARELKDYWWQEPPADPRTADAATAALAQCRRLGQKVDELAARLEQLRDQFDQQHLDHLAKVTPIETTLDHHRRWLTKVADRNDCNEKRATENASEFSDRADKLAADLDWLRREMADVNRKQNAGLAELARFSDTLDDLAHNPAMADLADRIKAAEATATEANAKADHLAEHPAVHSLDERVVGLADRTERIEREIRTHDARMLAADNKAAGLQGRVERLEGVIDRQWMNATATRFSEMANELSNLTAWSKYQRRDIDELKAALQALTAATAPATAAPPAAAPPAE